jgi:hypothetical protein
MVDAVEAWYRQHGTLHFYVWLGLIALKTHLKGSQAPGTLGCMDRSDRGWLQKSASPSPRKIGLAGKPFINQVRLDFPRKRSGREGVQDAVQPAWNDFGAERWVSSLNFVNAAGLRPQDSAFVGLSNFPSFDRNHAGEELGKLRFGFF